MALLDEMSGFEFEEVMVTLFRQAGYENVRRAAQRRDEGRDVLMEEVVDGGRRAVVVECKHTDTVGRPVVQKLHSAVATYDYDGPKRGMVATSGRFTQPAEEYAAALDDRGDPFPVELVDGRDVRELADEAGVEIRNGRVEILCDETLPPVDPDGSVYDPVVEAARDVQHLSPRDFHAPTTQVTFRPVVVVEAETDAVFETEAGVVHRVDDRTTKVAHADGPAPQVASHDVAEFVTANLDRRVPFEERVAAPFDADDVCRFDGSEREYADWAVERLRAIHSTTVSYTGANGVTYEKTCEPAESDVAVRSATAVYLPLVRQAAKIGGYTYTYEYYAAGDARHVTVDEFHRCVQCGTDSRDEAFVHCRHCGRINCDAHVKTDSLDGTTVCTECALTGRFGFQTRYFADEANREAYREQWGAMPLHRKAGQRPALVVGLALLLVVVLLLVVGVLGT